MKELSLSRSALVSLIDQMYPAPDDVGPWGPFGPWVRWVIAGLNPQPLPPKVLERWGPVPDPVRARIFAGTVLKNVSELSVLAEALGDNGRSADVGAAWLERFVNDWCGNEPIKGPFGPVPDPWRPISAADVHPANLVVAGAMFDRAAGAIEDAKLRDAVARAADQLLETGMSRLSR